MAIPIQSSSGAVPTSMPYAAVPVAPIATAADTGTTGAEGCVEPGAPDPARAARAPRAPMLVDAPQRLVSAPSQMVPMIVHVSLEGVTDVPALLEAIEAARRTYAPQQQPMGSFACIASDLEAVADRVASGNPLGVSTTFSAALRNLDGSVDVNALVQWVLRESYLQSNEDLAYYAEKVRALNDTKKAIRAHLAELRKMQAELASVKEEDAAKTGLDGKPVSGTESGEPGLGPDGEVLNVTSAEQRAQDYPEQNATVQEFLSYEGGDGTTDLETRLLNDPDAKAELLAAIPYMTGAELAQVMRAFGGDDMVVKDELKGIWSEMIDHMSDGQLLELGALAEKPGHYETSVGMGPNGSTTQYYVANPYAALQGGDLSGLLEGKMAAAKARVESKTGKTFASFEEAATAWKAENEIDMVAARREKLGAADEGMLAAINAMIGRKAGAPITAVDMAEIIREGTKDLDSQAAGIELDDLRAFVEKYGDRLTPGARAVFEKYCAVADPIREAGGTGIPLDVWEQAMAELDTVSGEYAAADAEISKGYWDGKVEDATDEATGGQEASTDNQGSSEAEDEAAAERIEEYGYDPQAIDLDRSDGSIDEVMVSVNPPHLTPTGEKITTKAELDSAIESLEEKLNSVGDDAQLANVDLQNMLQKQQQYMQMMSNIAKMLHDTALNTIRKMGA